MSADPSLYPLRVSAQLTQHLRALRKQRGLTQAQLGALLGLGQARIAEIEAKPGAVSFDQLLRLMSVLGAELLLQAGPLPPAVHGSVEPPPVFKANKGSW